MQYPKGTVIDIEFYFVKAKDRASSLATRTFDVAMKSGTVELQALGDGNIKTAVKAATMALGYIFSANKEATLCTNYGTTQLNQKKLPAATLTLKITG